MSDPDGPATLDRERGERGRASEDDAVTARGQRDGRALDARLGATAGQLSMADVVRELQAFADAAARAGDPALLDSAERARALLVRLRAQFVFEVAGPGSPTGLSRIDAA